MSIVLEALEKAQRKGKGIREEKKETLSQKELSKDIPLPRAKKPSRSYGIYFWVIILCIAGLNLWLLNWWLNRDEAVVSPRDLKAPSQAQLVEEVSSRTEGVFIPISTVSKKPKVTQENRGSVLTVSGVVWDPYEPIALVNGEFLKEGDQILGATIKEIQLNRVKFLYNDEEFTVSVRQ